MTDFPIEPAHLVPATGIFPAQVASTTGVNEEGLARALRTFGHERLGEVVVEPVVNPFESPSGSAVRPDGSQGAGDSWDGVAGRPRIVAMRFNGGRVRQSRRDLGLSQEAFARAVREAGARLGEPNGCTKRNVQNWEAGKVRMPRVYLRHALEAVTGLPFVVLCTPVLPPDPQEAEVELSAIVTDLNEVVHRIARIQRYLTR